MNVKSINYILSERETIKLLNTFVNTSYWTPLLFSIFVFFVTFEIIFYPNQIAIGDIAGIIIMFSLYICLAYSVISTKKCRYNTKEILKNEQKINFKVNEILFNCGKYNIAVPLSKIKRIKKTKLFYRIEFNLNRYDKEYLKIMPLSNIPCRVISEQEMESLATELKIKFK